MKAREFALQLVKKFMQTVAQQPGRICPSQMRDHFPIDREWSAISRQGTKRMFEGVEAMTDGVGERIVV